LHRSLVPVLISALATTTRGVRPACGLSLLSFRRRVASCERPRRCFSFLSFCLRFSFCSLFFSCWLFSFWLRYGMGVLIPVPASNALNGDGGHVAGARCAQLRFPFAAECLQFFGVLPQGIPESFEWSWLPVWQNWLGQICVILATHWVLRRFNANYETVARLSRRFDAQISWRGR
jgi:hypothetical protein